MDRKMVLPLFILSMCTASLFLSVTSCATLPSSPTKERRPLKQWWSMSIGFMVVPRLTQELASDMGIKVRDLKKIFKENGLEIKNGLTDLELIEAVHIVTGIAKGSVAQQVGIKRGDVILTWNPEEILWDTLGIRGSLLILRAGTKKAEWVNVETREHKLDEAIFNGAEKSSSSAHTLIVDQSGKGDYLTVTGAFLSSRRGDTILIREGTYPESVLLTSGITLMGDKREKVVLTSDDFFILQAQGSEDINIQRLTFKGGATTSSLLINKSSNINLIKNVIQDGKEGIRVENSKAVNIENNKIFKTKIQINEETKDPKQSQEAYGINIEESDVKILNNSIRGFTAGIRSRLSDVRVRNNVIERNVYGVLSGSSMIWVEGNVIQNNIEDGIYIGRATEGDRENEKILENNPTLTIVNNKISGNNRGIGISLSSAKISFNVISENENGGLLIYMGPVLGTGKRVVGGSQVEIINNTIVQNKNDGILIGGPNSDAQVYNNIVAFNEYGIGWHKSVQLKIGFNNVFNTYGNYFHRWDDRLLTKTGETIPIVISKIDDNLGPSEDQHVDPGFENMQSGDFHLKIDSPLIGKGKGGTHIGALGPASQK